MNFQNELDDSEEIYSDENNSTDWRIGNNTVWLLIRKNQESKTVYRVCC